MIKDNISGIKERIVAVCSKINREPNSIIIVCVSKGRTPQEIKEAIEAGITDIGENRVQEAIVKYKALSPQEAGHSTECGTLGLPIGQGASPFRYGGVPASRKAGWHMVGHLQTNKAKDAVRIFDLIQSVDTFHLAKELDKQAALINKIQDCLIEIKTSPEATKLGIKPDEALEVIEKIGGLKNINIKGLMTIAPAVDNPQEARPYFRLLRELRDRINNLQLTTYNLQLLSMGMTDDFEVAIEEGSTMVRLGRAIFEG